MSNRRTHVIIPERKRQQQLTALRAATGAWRLADHPELKDGAVAYQRKLRAENERRLKKQISRPRA